MNKDMCNSFVVGMKCQGHEGSEMCRDCPCFNRNTETTPANLERMRFYQDQNESSRSITRRAEPKASEQQVGGTHYTDMGIQPFEFTYANYGYIGLKAAVHTKVNKYLGRVKDNEVEQLKKARHCLDILIEKAELQ